MLSNVLDLLLGFPGTVGVGQTLPLDEVSEMWIGHFLVGMVVALGNDTFDRLEALNEFGLSFLFDLKGFDVLAGSIGVGKERLFGVEDGLDVVVDALEARVRLQKVVGLVGVVKVRVTLPLDDEAHVLRWDVLAVVEVIFVSLVTEDALDDVVLVLDVWRLLSVPLGLGISLVLEGILITKVGVVVGVVGDALAVPAGDARRFEVGGRETGSSGALCFALALGLGRTKVLVLVVVVVGVVALLVIIIVAGLHGAAKRDSAAFDQMAAS